MKTLLRKALEGSRLRVLLAMAVAGLLGVAPSPGAARAPRFPVIDLHVDLPYQVGFKHQPVARGRGRYVAKWLPEAGVEAVVFPLFVPQDIHPGGPRRRDLEASFERMTRLLPHQQPYNLRPCGGEGVGVFFAFEGAAPLGRHLEDVWTWGRRGVRLFGLVHSHDNNLATSAGYGYQPRKVTQGLSALGVELMRRIHAIGGLIDVSHASDASIADIIRYSKAEAIPVVATHSNARALARHTRNLTDAQLRAIGESGGIVGVNFHSTFLLGSNATAKLSDVVRHIRHMVRVAGVEHVGIGSDFEGGIRPPPELSDIRGFPRLAQALLDDGLSESAVRKVMGGNARRLLCPGQ